MRPAAELNPVPRDPPDAGAPKRRAGRRRRGPGLAFAWVRTGLVAVPVIAGLVALAPPEGSGGLLDEPRVTASLPSPARRDTDSPWQPVASPAFAVSGPEWRGRDIAVAARRNVSTGAREDAFTAGAFEAAAPFLHLVVIRDPRSAPAATLFLAVARRAAAAGLAVARTGPSSPLATRFGAAEIAPVTLASGAGERACTALRLKRPDGGFGLEGWVCGAQGQPPTAAKLACALDGLTLASGAGQATLKAVFVQADRRGSESCDEPERNVAASGRVLKVERR